MSDEKKAAPAAKGFLSSMAMKLLASLGCKASVKLDSAGVLIVKARRHGPLAAGGRPHLCAVDVRPLLATGLRGLPDDAATGGEKLRNHRWPNAGRNRKPG